MKKIRFIIVVFIIIIVQIIATFIFVKVNIESGENVIVNRKKYNELKEVGNRFKKLLYLEDQIKKRYYKKVDDVNFDDAILKGLVKGLGDEYSQYMTKKDYEEYMKRSSGEYKGIGVYLDIKNPSGFITVIEPIKGSPADKAGLKPGDQIIKVEDKEYYTTTVEKAVKVIKGGKEGTKVKILIRRDSKEIELKIERANVKSPSVYKHKYGDIGYLRITHFNEKSASEFKKQLDILLKQNIKSLIIDLRNNPGGYLREVNSIADRILGKTPVETISTRDKITHTFHSDEKTKLHIPFVVLVNRYSASASEILAGAVKDTKSAAVIGEKTFGKGIVQQIIPLGDGTYYKITTSYYLTPNGTNIHKKGILPNIDHARIKKEGYDPEDKKNDRVLDYAIKFLKDK